MLPLAALFAAAGKSDHSVTRSRGVAYDTLAMIRCMLQCCWGEKRYVDNRTLEEKIAAEDSVFCSELAGVMLNKVLYSINTHAGCLNHSAATLISIYRRGGD